MKNRTTKEKRKRQIKRTKRKSNGERREKITGTKIIQKESDKGRREEGLEDQNRGQEK